MKKFKQPDSNDDENYIFRNKGDTWAVKYNNELKNIKHTKCMDYIAFLLRHQGQEIHSMKICHSKVTTTQVYFEFNMR